MYTLVEQKKIQVPIIRPNIPQIFLEVEIYNHNIETREAVSAFFGVGTSFTSFEQTDQISDWKLIDESEEKLVFQTNFKTTNKNRDEKECYNTCENNSKRRRLYCNLSCPELKKPECLRIQAKRKHVASYYDDGAHAWIGTEKVRARGKRDDVKLGQHGSAYETEELLTQILFYTNSEEQRKEYEEETEKEVMPLLNKIMILYNDRQTEHIVDRFIEGIDTSARARTK
jgi:hypothetical protein